MTNVKIKTVGKGSDGLPSPTTSKAFIRDGNDWPPLLPGEIVALEDDEADWLMDRMDGYLEITKKPANRPSPPPRGGPSPNREVDPELVKVMEHMDLTNGNLWTSSGLPRMNHVEQTIGRNIDAADRDAAWEVAEANIKKRLAETEAAGQPPAGDEPPAADGDQPPA